MRQYDLRPKPRHGRWLFWLGLAAYAATYLAFYPRIFAIADENAYFTQALLLRTGRLTYEGSGVPAPQMSVDMAGRLASKYPPGASLFLVPFTLPGWRWVFVSGLVLALAGTWLFRLVLRRLEPSADPAWSFFYLLYPAVVLFSRTIMSDLLAATAVLAAFWFLLKGRQANQPQRHQDTRRPRPETGNRPGWLVAAGLCLGFACLVRYSAVILVPAFLVLLLRLPVDGRRSAGQRTGLLAAALLLAGLVPFGLAVLFYNGHCYGGPFRFPMYLTGVFSPAFLAGNLAFYLPALLVLYPLMLFAPLASGPGRRLLALPACLALAPYLFFSYVHALPASPAGFVLGMRYALPALPFFVLGYVLVLHRLGSRARGAGAVRFVAVLALLVLNVGVQWYHHRYLAAQDSCRRLVADSVPEEALLLCNADVSELLSAAWGWRDHRNIAQHNVPLPWESAAAARDTVYAALLERPGRHNPTERAIFLGLVARFPDRSLVLETGAPRRLTVFRLKPAVPRPQPGPAGGSAAPGRSTRTQ